MAEVRLEKTEIGKLLFSVMAERDALRAESERLRAALTEITELDLEGDASLADAMHIADEALNP